MLCGERGRRSQHEPGAGEAITEGRGDRRPLGLDGAGRGERDSGDVQGPLQGPPRKQEVLEKQRTWETEQTVLQTYARPDGPVRQEDTPWVSQAALSRVMGYGATLGGEAARSDSIPDSPVWTLDGSPQRSGGGGGGETR